MTFTTFAVQATHTQRKQPRNNGEFQEVNLHNKIISKRKKNVIKKSPFEKLNQSILVREMSNVQDGSALK